MRIWHYGNYHEKFDALPVEDGCISQEFLKFITEMDGQKDFKNIELLFRLEREYPGIMVKTMSDFHKAKSFKKTLDENGEPIVLSWEETLKKFYVSEKYKGVTMQNADIAELYEQRGLSQEAFDETRKLRSKQIADNISPHILGKKLEENTILESIEEIKNRTAEEIINGKEMVDELWDKQFTYEWLDKYNPHNPIIGLDCSCCATIISKYYGKEIAKKSMIAPDVQNLVIRDAKGKIISKGTMYMNKEKGYAVFNDFELNKEYRKHEVKKAVEPYGGRYTVDPESKDEQQRDLIFKAYQRGIKAFIEEYDKQNPENPLQQVNVGMGYNRLKRQVEQFKKASQNLTVPADYSFQDAKEEQYILYKREETKEKKGEIR